MTIYRLRNQLEALEERASARVTSQGTLGCFSTIVAEARLNGCRLGTPPLQRHPVA
jgi:hypothetical protein